MTDRWHHGTADENNRAELDLLTEATLAARRAPSILNTQPWRWQLTGDTAELWIDRTRQAHGLDPDGRLLLISCGAALHHAMTALRAGGYAGAVSRFPDSRRPDLVARLRRGPRCTPENRSYRAIYVRRTDRRPFADRPLSAEDFDALLAATARHNTHLTILTSGQVNEFARIVAGADALEQASRSTTADLRAWTTRSAGTGDGISSRTITHAGGREIPPRLFNPQQSPGLPLGHGTEQGTRYAIVTTAGDGAPDWLTAGEALSDVWLTLTARGLVASPISEVVEVRPAREAVRDLLRTVEHPAIALRIGFPADPDVAPPGSARRSESDVVGLPGQR